MKRLHPRGHKKFLHATESFSSGAIFKASCKAHHNLLRLLQWLESLCECRSCTYTSRGIQKILIHKITTIPMHFSIFLVSSSGSIQLFTLIFSAWFIQYNHIAHHKTKQLFAKMSVQFCILYPVNDSAEHISEFINSRTPSDQL